MDLACLFHTVDARMDWDLGDMDFKLVHVKPLWWQGTLSCWRGHSYHHWCMYSRRWHPPGGWAWGFPSEQQQLKASVWVLPSLCGPDSHIHCWSFQHHNWSLSDVDFVKSKHLSVSKFSLYPECNAYSTSLTLNTTPTVNLLKTSRHLQYLNPGNAPLYCTSVISVAGNSSKSLLFSWKHFIIALMDFFLNVTLTFIFMSWFGEFLLTEFSRYKCTGSVNHVCKMLRHIWFVYIQSWWNDICSTHTACQLHMGVTECSNLSHKWRILNHKHCRDSCPNTAALLYTVTHSRFSEHCCMNMLHSERLQLQRVSTPLSWPLSREADTFMLHIMNTPVISLTMQC